jgi:hypothetical protein
MYVREPTGAWQEVEIPGSEASHPEALRFSMSLIAFTDQANTFWLCAAWGDYVHGALESSCSHDGLAWQAIQTIAYTQEPTDPAAEQPRRGYEPQLLYDAAADKLMAIWTLVERGERPPAYLVYSYRKVNETTWTPIMNGPDSAHDPALPLFPATPWRGASELRVAEGTSGLAIAVWTERDENTEVFAGLFNPGAMLTEVER